MSCVIDKADNFRVLESDNHFSDFTGVHPSKIKQGKLSFIDTVVPQDRENVKKQLCKKNSPYIYIDFYMLNKDGESVFIHCLCQNIEGTTRSRLALADVSQSEKKSKLLKRRADSMNRLIDLVEGGVCLFKVEQDMRIKLLYMNKACARFFGTYKENAVGNEYRLDGLIHKDDKSAVFQAIGNCMATHKPIDMELRVQTHSNSFIWCKLNSAIQRYDDDGCPIFHAVFTDITKVKAAEQEADSERDILVNVFKNLPGPMFIASIDAPFILDIVSSDFIQLIGYTRKEFFEELGGDLSRLIDDDDEPRQELLSGAEENETVKTTYTLTTKSGKKLTVVDRRRVVESDSGEQSTIGILKDIKTA